MRNSIVPVALMLVLAVPAVVQAQTETTAAPAATTAPPAAQPPSAAAEEPGEPAETASPAETESAAETESPAEEESEWLDWLATAPEDAPLLQFEAGPVTLAPTAMMQLLGVPWQGSAAQLANGGYVNEPGFRFRRARIGFSGTAPQHLSFAAEAEFNQDGARLLDLNLTWAPFEALALSGGAGYTPFSASELTDSRFQTFLDRPWGVDGQTADGQQVGIAPGRMLGIWLSGAWSVLRWTAGVYNGNGDYFIGDNNSGMLYGARIECLPLGDLPDGQLMVEGGEPRVRIGGAYYFNDDAPGRTHAAEGDVKFRWQGLTIEGEFLWSTFQLAASPTRPADSAADVSRWAYYAQLGYLVWGDWLDISARFDSFELDDGVNDFNDRWTIAGVATLFVLRNRLKLQVEYDHHQEWFAPQLPNDAVALQLQGRF